MGQAFTADHRLHQDNPGCLNQEILIGRAANHRQQTRPASFPSRLQRTDTQLQFFERARKGLAKHCFAHGYATGRVTCHRSTRRAAHDATVQTMDQLRVVRQSAASPNNCRQKMAGGTCQLAGNLASSAAGSVNFSASDASSSVRPLASAKRYARH